jgi:hypothetical protein
LLTVLVALLSIAGVVWLFGERPSQDGQIWHPEATGTVWAIEGPEVQSVEIVGPSTLVRLVRGPAGWVLSSDESTPASPGAAGALIDTLAGLQQGLPVPNGVPEDFGLSQDLRHEVILTLTGGQTERLWIGSATPIGWRTYVQRPQGPILVVPGLLADTVLKGAEEWRDLAFLRFDLAQADQAVISSRAGTLDVFLQDGRWWVRGFGRANLDRVDDLFVGLANLRLEGWLDGAATEPLEAPVFEVKVGLKDGTTKGFQVGTQMPMGRLIRKTSGLTGYAKSEALALLNQGPAHVADPKAFPISPTESRSIKLIQPTRQLSLTDNGSGWQLANGSSAASMVDRLVAVGAHYRLEPVPALSPPLTRVIVARSQDDKREVFVGSGRVDETWLVAMEGPNETRFLIDADGWEAVLAEWPVD